MFENDEERFQYQTFTLHDPARSLIRQVVPASKPSTILPHPQIQALKPPSRPSTPGSKLSLKDYVKKSKDAGRAETKSPAVVIGATFDKTPPKPQSSADCPHQSPQQTASQKESDPIQQVESQKAPAIIEPQSSPSPPKASFVANLLPPSLRSDNSDAVFDEDLDRSLPASLSLEPLSKPMLKVNGTSGLKPLPKPTSAVAGTGATQPNSTRKRPSTCRQVKKRFRSSRMSCEIGIVLLYIQLIW